MQIDSSQDEHPSGGNMKRKVDIISSFKGNPSKDFLSFLSFFFKRGTDSLSRESFASRLRKPTGPVITKQNQPSPCSNIRYE